MPLFLQKTRRSVPRGAVVAALIALVAIGAHFYVRSLGPRARTRVIKALEKRFDADVQLSNVQLFLFPHPRVEGVGLSIRHKSWKDPEPLISIRRFSAQSSFWNLLFQRDKVRIVRLEGLRIHIPHRGKSANETERRDDQEVESGKPGQDRNELQIRWELWLRMERYSR